MSRSSTPSTSLTSATGSVENNIIFGPVHSRRFGKSLGVDLSPAHKQCDFDCLYCELAPAPAVSHQENTVSVDAVIAALQSALHAHTDIDAITITANGEPTLYPHLDDLMKRIDKIKGGIKTLILTNSATLVDPEVFATLLKFDRVKLSLDAVTQGVFQKIDRPAKGILIGNIVNAAKRFAHAYAGELYIEILFVHGLNDSNDELSALNAVLRTIPCKRIDIGSIDRPPAYPVQGLSYKELHAAAATFDTDLPIHIASRTHAESCQSSYSDPEILNTLDKRPLTREDIELLFDAATQERFEALVDSKSIVTEQASGVVFYMPAETLAQKRRKAP